MDDRAACFDVMGTLFDLASVERGLRAVGAPPASHEAWLGRTLHAATSMTLAGQFRPFDEVAEATLRSLFVRLGLDEALAADVLAELGRLDAYADAGAALERLAGADVRVLAVTNGTTSNTRALLARSGLDGAFDAVVSTEDVRAYKPHRAVYDRAVELTGLPASSVTLIAAHGWDVLGARAAGLDAVWVDRVERRWPLPVDPPRARAESLAEAAELVVGG